MFMEIFKSSSEVPMMLWQIGADEPIVLSRRPDMRGSMRSDSCYGLVALALAGSVIKRA
jgi:hypothetical protein